MARPKAKAATRRERSHPQTWRVFSHHAGEPITPEVSACWVPYADVAKLERKYLNLFKRYQREKARG